MSTLTGCSAVLYGKADPDEERLRFLDHAYNLGSLFWDTAEGYLDNEELIGRWFAKSGKREEVRCIVLQRMKIMLTRAYQDLSCNKVWCGHEGRWVSRSSERSRVHQVRYRQESATASNGLC